MLIIYIFTKNSNEDIGETSDEESELKNGRNTENRLHFFEKGHPQAKTLGHRYRKVERWPKYSAKRLPDVPQLCDESNMDDEERNVKREEYAKGVLIMFHPFRDLKGNLTFFYVLIKKLHLIKRYSFIARPFG